MDTVKMATFMKVTVAAHRKMQQTTDTVPAGATLAENSSSADTEASDNCPCGGAQGWGLMTDAISTIFYLAALGEDHPTVHQA